MHRSQGRVGWILLLWNLAGSTSIAMAEDASRVEALKWKADRLIEEVELLRQEARIPGLSIAVIDHGEVALQAGLGYADLETKRLATSETPYDVASVTEALAPPHLVDDRGSVVRAPQLSAQGDGAAGGLVATVADLAKFDIALDSHRLLTPRIEERHDDAVPEQRR